jgi:hypothetical protein
MMVLPVQAIFGCGKNREHGLWQITPPPQRQSSNGGGAVDFRLTEHAVITNPSSKLTEEAP